MHISKIEKWGVDIGNVLLWNLPENLRVARETNQLSITEIVEFLEEVPEAFAGLKFLIDHVGSEPRLQLVRMCLVILADTANTIVAQEFLLLKHVCEHAP